MSTEAADRRVPTWLLVAIVPVVFVIAIMVTNFVASDQHSVATGSASAPVTRR